MLGLMIDESEIDFYNPDDVLKYLRAQSGKFDRDKPPATDKIPDALMHNKEFVIQAIKQPHYTVDGSILYKILGEYPKLLSDINILAHIDLYYKNVRGCSLEYIIENNIKDYWMKLYIKEVRQSQRYKKRYQEIQKQREKNKASGPKELRGIFSIDDVD